MLFGHGDLSWYKKPSADTGVADIDGYTNPSNMLELPKIIYTINLVLHPGLQATYITLTVPSTVAQRYSPKNLRLLSNTSTPATETSVRSHTSTSDSSTSDLSTQTRRPRSHCPQTLTPAPQARTPAPSTTTRNQILTMLFSVFN